MVSMNLTRSVACAALALMLPAALCAQQAKLDRLDPHKLPLGDGKLTDRAQAGYVYSCQQRFRSNAPGAQVVGPWIHFDAAHGDTWDLTQKISVQGRVTWPDAQFRIAVTDDGRVVARVITGNGLPVATPTGTFPVPRSDPAFQIDRNPNSIQAQTVAITLPLHPEQAAQPACVPMGMIGVALNGVAIYNAFDEGGRDAVAHEVQDLCSGHPQMSGEYHYHGPSPCLPGEDGNETLVGYALDGFGIFSIYDAKGRELTDADLDACHGRVSEVEWEGKRQAIYHYVLTREFPYTLGCFRGTPVRMPRKSPPPARGFGPPPPPDL